jgi:hypothetical protein
LANRETIELFDAEVAASEVTLSQSKTVGKSAKDDLQQHERWLERHAAAEARSREKHERRLKQLRISHRHWVKRQRLLRSARQRASIIVAASRSAAHVAGDKAVSAANYSRDRLSAAAAWSRPRLQSAASASYNAGNAGYAWLKLRANDSAIELSKAGKIVGAKAHNLALILASKSAVGFKWLGRTTQDLGAQLSKSSRAALAWSRVNGRVLAHSASNTASIGFDKAKRKTGSLAQSVSGLTDATGAQARTYGSQALALAGSWSEKARSGTQQLQASVGTSRFALNLQSPPTQSALPSEENSGAAQESEEKAVIEFQDKTPSPEAPVQKQGVSAWVDTAPKALAASALSKPMPASGGKAKGDKTQAKEKTRRGGRGGKKTRKQKSGKSKSK